jgi:hypothetical protein
VYPVHSRITLRFGSGRGSRLVARNSRGDGILTALALWRKLDKNKAEKR